MAKLQKRSLNTPDEVRPVGRGRLEVVSIDDAAFGRIVYQPGWRWTTDVRAIAGTDLCEIHHMGYVISGQLHTEMRDGSTMEAVAGDIFEIPPGHDAWVVGDEPWVSIDWRGRRHFAAQRDASGERRLATILFTDLVGSTSMANQMGDKAWREVLAEYLATVRRSLENHRGREIGTTGDGVMAVFDSPAHAAHCALDLARDATDLGLQQRAGLHTGEVEFAGEEVRGIAVHLAARVSAAAGPGELLVSSTANALLLGSGLKATSRGIHDLKGIEQPVELFSVER
ncbi:MAG TPA: adenylate/guanylate cyclase domain-containing protein [Candidatus Limnocylindria bacterium]|nr:adenylate/guanylate cyclase domain-containing protein [Candidatus Limnocylindria bacterium]